MKIGILLLALLTLTTIGSLFAEMNQRPSSTCQMESNACYQFNANPPKDPIVIMLNVGSWLRISGNQDTEVVGGNEITHVGERQFNGTHMIKYEGGIGGKEGKKTTYNVSLWSFNKDDYTASIEDESNAPLMIKDANIHNLRGLWKFQAVNPTPENAPQELKFTNKDGSVGTIKVIVYAAE